MKPSVTVLLVDDDDTFRLVMGRELEQLGFKVVAVSSGVEAQDTAPTLEPEVVLLDLQLPDVDGLQVLRTIRDKSPGSEVIMLSGHGSIDTAIEAVQLGAFDFVTKPCPLAELEVRIQRALERRALRLRTSLLERGLTPADPASFFIGDSPAFRQLMQRVERAAPSDSTVLICGETGSGKGMVAKLLHARSPRRERPFVLVECASLHEGLLQSELFGHQRGAFTGADRAKPGLFEVAHGGTIFLDEIGEVSQALQAKLLRVLDTSIFRRVGGTAEILVDVRVLAATNQDLATLVRQGMFREDLYYRLTTIAVDVPPLRERADDVQLLAAHFVTWLNDHYGFCKRIGATALDVLHRHRWPGNVRELQHVIEAAFVLCEGSEILPEHLPASFRELPSVLAYDPAAADRLPTIRELERAHIERVLRATGGHRADAAKILGISERSLYRKVGKYDLPS